MAPVFIGFALSMSLMFMTILKTSIHPGQTEAEKLAAKQGITSLTGMKCGDGDDKYTCDLMGLPFHGFYFFGQLNKLHLVRSGEQKFSNWEKIILKLCRLFLLNEQKSDFLRW